MDRACIRTGIQDSIAKSLDVSGLFNRVGPAEELFSPKTIDSPYQEVIQSLNNQYSSEVIRRFVSEEIQELPIYEVNPSEDLVGIYEREYTQENAEYSDERQRISDEDYQAVLEEIELTQTSTPQDFIDKNMQEYSKQISQFRKANPDFTIEFDDEDTAYDENTNKIKIDLTELAGIANQWDIPLQQVVSIMIIHEMAHAATSKAIGIGENKAFLNKLYLAAIDNHRDKVPFEDVMRQGFQQANGQPYAFKNVHEFVAEAFSNPYFQEYLQSIPYEGEKSLLQTIWDAILKFFNFTQENKPSLYDEVVNFVNSEKIQRDNREAEAHPSTEWDPQLVYRGNPKVYAQAAFELFTSPNIKNNYENNILKKLPDIVAKVKKELDYATQPEKIQTLKKLLDAFNDVKENDTVINVSINMLLEAGYMAQDMNRQLLEVDKIDDEGKRLTMAFSLLRNIEALEPFNLLAQDVVTIVEREGVSANIKTFVNTIKDINNITSAARRRYLEIAQPLVMKQLISENEGGAAEKSVNQQIKFLNDKLVGETSPTAIRFIKDKIKKYEEQMLLLPTKSNFDLIATGQYRDSSSSQLLFQAGMANGHILPSTLMKRIRQNNISVSQQMIKIANEHQVEQDLLKKAIGVDWIRSTDKVYSPIRTLVSRADTIEEDENGNPIIVDGKPKFVYTTSKMLLSEYDPDYIKQATEKKAQIDYYYKKLSQADRTDDTQNLEKYRQLLTTAYKERRDFFRVNSEGRYQEEVLQMYDLLEKEITKPDGTKTTFGKERGYIFEDIEQAERRRNEEILPETLDLLQEEIQQLRIELGQLKSKWDGETGQEKTGFEKELSDIATQYSELKTKYGTYEITEQGQALFDRAKLRLDQQLSTGDISQEEYERRIGEISATELSEEYYQTVKGYQDKLAVITTQLANIPEFTSIFKGVNVDKIDQGYAKIRDLVRGFRDSDMTIDGQLFSKVRPELVKEIQAIQQETENMRAIAARLMGLSKVETIRFKELRKKEKRGELTDDEFGELVDIRKKSKATQETYTKYKELIDEYHALWEEFAALNDASSTQYYQDELEHQKAAIISQKTLEIMELSKKVDSLEGGKYTKINGKWHEVIKKSPTRESVVPIALNMKGFKTEQEALANRIARKTADEEIRKTQWWKDNHYQRYKGTQQGYVKVDSPIYIWMKKIPTEERYIKQNQPSIKFKTYRIYDGREVNGVREIDYTNRNHSLLNDSIPVPKKDVFRNAEYEKLKNATDGKSKGYFRYLEFARKSLRRAQEFLPSERRLGDMLPSLIKTEDELAVEFTNNILDRSKKLASGQWALAIQASKDPDQQVVAGGSTGNFYAKNRIIPIRFSGRMDSDTQSSDIAAMTLAYENAAIEYSLQSEDQAFFETLRIMVENLTVLETKRAGAKLAFGNLFSAVKSKFVTQEKETTQSNLAKTVNHMLDTHVYGETRHEANITIKGVDYDLNKATSALKKVSSVSIFSLNAFVAVKNSISAYIQGHINSNIGQGFFTKSQYAKAHGEAVRHVKDFLLDYRKFGNKTKIGQELDYFQVMQGASYNEYGQKTAWTVLKNKVSFLTSLKNISEYELQVAQYLAMSKANPVEMADGTFVEMRKAFELKDGTLQPIAGAKITQKQIESFIFKLAHVNRIINGAYRAEEKNAIQKNILGDFAFYLNGYVVPLMVNRFGKTNHSNEADMITRGYIRETVGFISDLVKYRAGLTKQWSLLSGEERHRVLRGTKELLAIIGMAALVAALGGGSDKKELVQSAAIQNWGLAVALAVKAETETFVPIPGMGLNDMARKMNSPFAAVRQISLIIKTLQNFLALGVDQMGIANIDSAYYKSSTLKDGFHDKGDAKAIANLLKLIGWSGIAFDDVNKVLQQQNIQTLR